MAGPGHARCHRRARAKRRKAGPRRPQRLRDGPRRDALRDRSALWPCSGEGRDRALPQATRTKQPSHVPASAGGHHSLAEGILEPMSSAGTIVVGAGMSGLVRARAHLRRGEEVLLLETSSRPGGAVHTRRQDGFLLELGPNTVRPTPELWALVGDLGLREEALLADARLPRYVEWKGKLHALPMSSGGLLRTPLLSARGKLRLLPEPGRGGERPCLFHPPPGGRSRRPIRRALRRRHLRRLVPRGLDRGGLSEPRPLGP